MSYKQYLAYCVLCIFNLSEITYSTLTQAKNKELHISVKLIQNSVTLRNIMLMQIYCGLIEKSSIKLI